MASNIKAKPSSKESPTEPFKRAVTGCLRALGAQAGTGSGVRGRAARSDGRKSASAGAAAQARQGGGRDRSRPCRFNRACVLPATMPPLHRRLQPAGQQARAVFEAVEQARVEAIGARRMDGVAQNLTAMLDERFHRGKFDEITERADAPIEDALALMVRERLTGMAPPPAAKKLVDLWRPLIEDRAGQRSRSAGKPGRGPAPVRRCRSRSAGCSRNGRGPQPRLRGRRGRRRGRSPQAGIRRRRRSRGFRRNAAHEHGGHASVLRGHAGFRRRSGRGANRRHGRRHRHGRFRNARRTAAAASFRRQRTARPGLSRFHREI